MVSTKDDVFLKVEAVLSNDWVKSSGRDVTAILEEVENLGVEGINFHRGNYVVTGSLEQLLRIREHFLGKEKKLSLSKASEKRAAATADKQTDVSEWWSEPTRNDLSRSDLFSKVRKREESDEVARERAVRSRESPQKSGKEEERLNPAGNERKETKICNELMVDSDIWDYIENKKHKELKGLEDVFAATVTKTEDDSGVLKIAITPKSQDTALEDASLMHEALVSLYQDIFMKCVIEKHEVHFSDEEAQLVLEYLSEKFPDVFAKRCIYNDDFLFIGRPRMAREARQQFQVLAQRMKKGQLKARLDERLGLDDYDRSGRYRDSYEDRYSDQEDRYEDALSKYTNDFNNSSNEVTEENENESLTGKKDEVNSPVEATTGDQNNEISKEEEQEEGRQKPGMNLSKDLDPPAFGWNRFDKSKHLKSVDEVNRPSGSSSLIYRRPDIEEIGVAKRSNSDVEDDDWKQNVSDKNLERKKDQPVDELKHELPDRMSETSLKTKVDPEFSQDPTKTAWTTFALGECSRNEAKNKKTEFEGTKATKSMEDVSHRKEEQTEDDDHVLRKNPQPVKIDANSITYSSFGPCVSEAREEAASKSREVSLNDGFDEITGISERLEKKPLKSRKKAFDSEPKVKIIKPKIPVLSELGDGAASIQTEFASGVQVVNEPKVVSVKSNSKLVGSKTSTSGAVKSSYTEVLGEPCRPVSDLEERGLKMLFKKQKEKLQKMKYDSPSSEEDDDDDAEAEDRGNKSSELKQNRKGYKGERVTDEMIDELISRGDEVSQRALQSLLEEATGDSSGTELHIDNKKVENCVADEKRPGKGQFKVEDVPAEKTPVRRARAKAENYPAVPQPRDGALGCVIDKAFHLEGHDKSGTIEINISFEAGSQADDQAEPGRPYRGMTMKAYLPASGDGRETLRLMKAAFAARKLFTLQENDDDGDDVIIPNGVDFKDSADLYPDPSYLPKVMEQLRMLTENQDN